MIPKKIHYCWFGRNPLDEKAVRCIESWKKYFPEYEIIQWNEDNFDVEENPFAAKAYADKKWAFVSDVARLKIIYEHGGIYFDTDVEVIAPYADILSDGSQGFLGYEKTGYVSTGLGFGACAHHPLIGEMLECYTQLDYDAHRDSLSKIACPIVGAKVLAEHGFVAEERKQIICGLTVYPSEYFSPMDYYTGSMCKTRNTHSIHWYSDSWNKEEARKQRERERKVYRILGKRFGGIVIGVFSCLRQEGIIPYLKKRAGKLLKGRAQ